MSEHVQRALDCMLHVQSPGLSWSIHLFPRNLRANSTANNGSSRQTNGTWRRHKFRNIRNIRKKLWKMKTENRCFCRFLFFFSFSSLELREGLCQFSSEALPLDEDDGAGSWILDFQQSKSGSCVVSNVASRRETPLLQCHATYERGKSCCQIGPSVVFPAAPARWSLLRIHAARQISRSCLLRMHRARLSHAQDLVQRFLPQRLATQGTLSHAPGVGQATKSNAKSTKFHNVSLLIKNQMNQWSSVCSRLIVLSMLCSAKSQSASLLLKKLEQCLLQRKEAVSSLRHRK